MIAKREHRLSDKIMRKSGSLAPKDGTRFWEKITLKRKSLIPPAAQSGKTS